MIHEYIITAFKVIVGVITENRIALSALVALGVLLVWMFLSLVFSFQGKLLGNVKRINEYVSRNGVTGEAQNGFEMLITKMPSEFQKGYRKYKKAETGLPSDYINRFNSIDMELSGGVFNQNKSVLKTFIHFVFVSLTLFSFAILPMDEALTGYGVAEALIIPLLFFMIAKIMYYIYTATRQYQYKAAIEEFNYLMENLDLTVENSAVEKTFNYQPAITIKEEPIVEEGKEDSNEEVNKQIEELNNEKKFDVIFEPVNSIFDYEEANIEEQIDSNEEDNAVIKEETIEDDQEAQEEDTTIETAEVEVKEDHQDNFKPDFSSLFEGEEMEETVKRGRGRPRKEVTQVGEFVINNDKEFEDALLRAEKLMRKNEEPLSASQTKRIEKQIKELVDAMTKYKEGK